MEQTNFALNAVLRPRNLFLEIVGAAADVAGKSIASLEEALINLRTATVQVLRDYPDLKLKIAAAYEALTRKPTEPQWAT